MKNIHVVNYDIGSKSHVAILKNNPYTLNTYPGVNQTIYVEDDAGVIKTFPLDGTTNLYDIIQHRDRKPSET